jgi:hypothetical protein
MRTGGVLIGLSAAALALPAAAPAAQPDPFTIFFDGLTGGLQSQSRPRVCPELSGGTAGSPEPGVASQAPDRGNGLAPGDPTIAPASLPQNVYLRSTRQTYNRRYWFVLRRGHIYFKSNAEITGIVQPWAPLAAPACFDGRVQGISVDDDELVALARHRHVFTMDGSLSDPAAFNWTVRWGPHFWTGPGRRIPRGRTFSWSVASPREDQYFSDTAGHHHAFGEGKVSHIWLLNHGGKRLTYLDPWLPADHSYEMCGPKRGRFRSVGMSASGSTVFVINRFGDMFTRLYDFDISGADSLFDTYSYEDQRGKGANDSTWQLPSPPWIHQPKIPGDITGAISIEKEGVGSVHRVLRVAGMRAGKRGFWQKDIVDAGSGAWKFVRTGQRLRGRLLANSPQDTSNLGLGHAADHRYVMRGSGAPGIARAAIPNFNVYCTPARLRVVLASGKVLRLRLHTVDAVRQSRRARGLDNNPRLIQGTIEAPTRVLRSHDPAVHAFVAQYLTGGRFTTATIEGTKPKLDFTDQGWSFRRAHRRNQVPH